MSASERLEPLLKTDRAALGASSDASIGLAVTAVIGPGPGRGLVPCALDLLGADHAVEHEAQEDHGSTVDVPWPSGGRSGANPEKTRRPGLSEAEGLECCAILLRGHRARRRACRLISADCSFSYRVGSRDQPAAPSPTVACTGSLIAADGNAA
jgi:hypothetical protein